MMDLKRIARYAAGPVVVAGALIFGVAQTPTNNSTVDPYYYNAYGDGVHDDTTPVTNAVMAAIMQGKPLLLNGFFVVKKVIALAPAAVEELDIRGLGNAQILTQGNDFLQITPTATTPGVSHVFRFKFNDFDVINQSSSNDTGTVLTVNCLTYGNFCTGERSRLSNIHTINTGPLFIGTEVSHIDIEKSGSVHSEAIGVSVPFIAINPSNSSPCSSAVFVDDNYVVGGSFAVMDGCTQGFTFTRNNHLYGFDGIYNPNPVSNAGMQVSSNYLEEFGFGIFAQQGVGWQITNNSFDANPNGISANYQAIVVGAPTSPVGGSTVSGNVAYDLVNGKTNTVFYANMDNGSAFSSNTVDGLVNTSQCMSVGTNDENSSSDGHSPALTITGNTCSGAGVINLIGSTPLARGNEYFLSSSPRTLNKVELN